MSARVLVTAALMAACSNQQRSSGTSTSASHTSANTVPTAHATHPAQLVRVNGNCGGGRPIGALTNYSHRIKLRPGENGWVRVRSNPSWSAADLGNVIGTLTERGWVPAWGPLKGIPSNGIGYSVPLVDPNGNRCRGYVSRTVVRQMKCRPPTAFEPFPEPLDVRPGPCWDFGGD